MHAIAFKMSERVEQPICIKFCVEFEHSFAETVLMIQNVFGGDAMSAAPMKVWHKRFKDGRESVEKIKVIHVLEGLRQAEHLRILNVYRLRLPKTDTKD